MAERELTLSKLVLVALAEAYAEPSQQSGGEVAGAIKCSSCVTRNTNRAIATHW